MLINTKSLQGTIIFKNFKLIQKIGIGTFGQIYKAQNLHVNGQFFAVKIQSISTKQPQLQFQAKLYKYLHSHGSIQGIPKVYSIAIQSGYNMMLMDLLGSSLEQLFTKSNRKFSLKTVIMIGIQILNRIQSLHSKGFIHRDIKPDNLLIGTGNKQQIIYLIDLGLSKKFINKNSISVFYVEGHIPYREGKQLVGTARYASIATHKGFQQSRRDDIQSIGYILIYFLRGVLPWQNMKATTPKVKSQLIKNKKITTPLNILCKDFPYEFQKFIQYARQLKFDQKPDYQYLRNLLTNSAHQNNILLDNKYNWN